MMLINMIQNIIHMYIDTCDKGVMVGSGGGNGVGNGVDVGHAVIASLALDHCNI